MFFSIIIPVYNAEKYLEECLMSIIDQNTFSDYEILLIDDGSTDRSGKICDEFAKKYIFIKVFHQPNSGQLFARLKGINNAAGEYCIFVDADDLLKPNALQILYGKLASYAFPEMIIYNYTRRSNDDDENIYIFDKEKDLSFNKREIYDKLIKTNLLNLVWAKAIKKSVLSTDKTNYINAKNYLLTEDAFQSLIFITKSERIVYIEDVIYIYRINVSSVTNRKYLLSEVPKLINVEYLKTLLSHLKIWGLDTEEYRKEIYLTNIRIVLLIFKRIYTTTNNKDEKKQILNYNWSSFLIDNAEKKIKLKDIPYKRKLEFLAIKYKKSIFMSISIFLKKFYKIFKG